MGRKPELAETLALRGTTRRDRDHSIAYPGEKLSSLRECKVQGLEAANKRAKAFYKKTCSQMIALGVLEEIQLPLVLTYAITYDQYLSFVEDSAKGKYVPVRNEAGEVIRFAENPSIRLANKALTQIKSLASDLGISPIARQRLKTDSGDKKLNIQNAVMASISIYNDTIDDQS